MKTSSQPDGNNNRIKLFNLSHEFSAPAAEDKPIFLPFGTWAYDGKISQTFTREAAARIANELAADVAAGNPGIPVYQGHPDVPSLAAKYPDKGALGWVKKIDLSNEGCSLSVEWDRFPGKGFGWFSPYWFGEKTGLDNQGKTLVAVDHIESIGLVNTPNISEFRLPNESAEDKQKGKKMNREELIALLGLPPEATDDQIKEAIAANKAAAEKNAADEQKLAAANQDCKAAKADAQDAKDKLENERRAHEATKTELANERAKYQRLAELKTQSETVGLANEKIPETAEGKREKALALVNELQHTKGLSYNQAFACVQQRNPDLFK